MGLPHPSRRALTRPPQDEADRHVGYDRPAALNQSGRMFAFWTIALKRSASCFTRASNSAALEGMVSTPPPAKRSFTSGILRILTTSALSLSMTGCGVALGANSAVQLEASTSFTPSCCNVGHSGLSVE